MLTDGGFVTSEGTKDLVERASSRDWEESEWFKKWLEMNRVPVGENGRN
jgi:hypothetical protein